MRLIFLCAALLACAAAIPNTKSPNGDESNHWFQFGKFVQRYGKTYSSVEELSARFSIFKNWLNHIESHNARADSTYSLGINQFADHTVQELESRHLGPPPQHRMRNYAYRASDPAVTAIDWRSKGCVNAVRNAGQCGSSWAFAAVDSLECANFLKSGKLPALSVQQLVDCSNQGGCFGVGSADAAFNYVQNISLGLDSDASYPYTAAAGPCHFDSTGVAGTCSGHIDVTHNDEIALQAAVSSHVVSASIFADTYDFVLYKGGIFNSTLCPTDKPNLSVSIVGFDAIAGYWIIRNNWGVDWGENGYMRMVMGRNMCGLAAHASFALA
jgi:C1A family cysteine protease